ncbi:MAG: four helix bundle protein [Clostridia bacterium]|nr:four helix bundle protein [Clostridia bacterium]
MSKNCLLIYAEQLATDAELLCQNIKAPSNTLFQLRKSSSSVYANIREAQYAHGKADFISKLQIALKEANETGYWLELLYKTNYITETEYKALDTACTSIRVMLISSINTAKENAK